MLDAERCKYPSLPPSYFVQEKVVTLLKLFFYLISFWFFWAHLLCVWRSGGHTWTGVLVQIWEESQQWIISFSCQIRATSFEEKLQQVMGEERKSQLDVLILLVVFIWLCLMELLSFYQIFFILFSPWLTLSGYSKTLDQVKKLRCSKRILSCWKFIVRFAT